MILANTLYVYDITNPIDHYIIYIKLYKSSRTPQNPPKWGVRGPNFGKNREKFGKKREKKRNFFFTF